MPFARPIEVESVLSGEKIIEVEGEIVVVDVCIKVPNTSAKVDVEAIITAKLQSLAWGAIEYIIAGNVKRTSFRPKGINIEVEPLDCRDWLK